MKRLISALAVLWAVSLVSVSAQSTVLAQPIKHNSAKSSLCLPDSKLQVKSHSSHKLAPSLTGTGEGIYFESFEYNNSPYLWGRDQADYVWLPEGWSRVSNSDLNDVDDTWFVYPLQRYTQVPCYDGNYVMAILYNEEYKDEWLISPELSVSGNDYLTFAWYSTPLYFWVVNRYHVDYENGVFTDREIAATLKVYISVDGAEWQLLNDISDDFVDKEYDELSDLRLSQMQEVSISLAEYVGHKVRFAFQYVGKDGDSMFIDGVSTNSGVVALNSIYMSPLSTQYVGGSVDMDIFDIGMQLQPVNADLYWYNMSDNEVDASYSWNYSDFPVQYKDDEYLMANFPMPTNSAYDVYEAPSLTAEATGSLTTTYQENVKILAGGSVESDGRKYGLLPFDIVNDGLYYHTIETDFGERNTPIFGYDKNTDAFWRLYTCGGDEENLPHIPYAYLSGIINGIVPSEAPMVVNGAWVYALGKISEEAKFTLSIYALNEDGEFETKPLASKTINGSDVLVPDTWLNLDYLSLPFAFDEPVVLDEEGTEGGLYAVMLTGFHDGGVEYFAPLMQELPNKFEVCLGFYQIEYMYNGEHNVGLSYVAFHENDHGEMYCAFAINLDAEYPWLKADVDEITIGDEGAELSLNSYYDASCLDIRLANGNSLPEWLTVDCYGRYNKAKIIFSASDPEQAIDENIVISAPGVEQTVHLTKYAGIEDIIISDTETGTSYDLTGRKVNPTSPGLYIIKQNDGTYRKIIK